MPLQGLMFMIFILLIIPVLALSTNHFIFFGVMALIISVISIRNIYNRFFDIDSDGGYIDEEATEEIEDLINLNMKKFGTGINVVKELSLILFFIYCSFYSGSILLKIVAALLILIQIYYIKGILNDKDKKEPTSFSRNLTMLSSILSLVLVIFTTCNLIFGLNL